MRPFFYSEERIRRLCELAKSWEGTPFCPNSEVMGPRGGVSCHNLPRAIYIGCAFLDTGFPKIVGNPNGTRHKRESVIEPFIDGRREFARLRGEATMPGDLLGIRIYYCIDHLGVALPGGRFIHVLFGKHTDADEIMSVPPWAERIEAVWRPLEAESEERGAGSLQGAGSKRQNWQEVWS